MQYRVTDRNCDRRYNRAVGMYPRVGVYGEARTDDGSGRSAVVKSEFDPKSAIEDRPAAGVAQLQTECRR